MIDEKDHHDVDQLIKKYHQIESLNDDFYNLFGSYYYQDLIKYITIDEKL